MKSHWLVLSVLGVLLAPAPLAAQRRGFGGYCNGCEALTAPPNPKYDGRFTYARIKFTILGQESGPPFYDLKWGHDYPRSDRHFPKILGELTAMKVRTEESAIFALDDPELFKFPFVYLCEPGFWLPSDKEAAGLRDYMLKGGFVLVDDFVGNHWYNFETQLRKVLPEARPIPLAADHPIFDSFYRIPDLAFHDPNRGMLAQFYGIFEDNDPKKRMMAVINYNFDVSEFWEYSDTGLFPIDLSNTAYKLGVNYVVYALSH
jgi:hypothetical protein